MLESSSYSVVEGSSIDVCVMLSGQLEREVSLSLIAQPGTAQQHEDYVDITRIVSLLPGDSRVCFSLETLEDNIVEGDEMLQMVLNGDDSVFMNGNIVSITIKDNDSKYCNCIISGALLTMLITHTTVDAVFGLQTSGYTVGDDEPNVTIAIYVLDKELALPVELQLTSLDISARTLLQ